ncbi:MAG: class I SAM-dependent methyltransferase [Deltaproteobacteria bacterium]|nr:class I SAM-dependent methyltransferase [Deltaproteobacteria bacterium]
MPLNPYADLFEALRGERDELRLAVRKKLVWAYSWAVPGADAVAELARASSIVEIGAGTGYWAWLASLAGARVDAYDIAPEQAPKWYDVKAGGPERAREHGDAALLMVWPPYESTMAAEALAGHGGSRVFYVGELRGRTADDSFHEALDSRYRLEKEIPIPRWPGFNDGFFVYVRR